MNLIASYVSKQEQTLFVFLTCIPDLKFTIIDNIAIVAITLQEISD